MFYLNVPSVDHSPLTVASSPAVLEVVLALTHPAAHVFSKLPAVDPQVSHRATICTERFFGLSETFRKL